MPHNIRLTRAERLAVLGVWLALGLTESVKAYLERRFTGGSAAWSTVLVGNLPWWLMWATLTPAVIALARRVRFERRTLAPLLVHLTASVVLSLLHHAVVGTLFYFTNTRGLTLPIGGVLTPMTLGRQFQSFFAAYFMLNVLTYWAIVAGYFGLEFYKRYREGELRAARLEATMHVARLDALRMELNPHFLFNTLNAISGLVRGQRSEQAVSMLARLAELLRLTLEDAKDPEVPLEKELEFLRTYLAIEQIRFGDRLRVEISAEPGALRALVPPLILQPLVENAVRHGIALQQGPARIEVRASVADERLHVTIVNTGPAPTEGDAANGTRIGLANTRERLRHAFGSSAALRLRQLPDGGFEAALTAPLRDVSESVHRPT